VDLEGRVIGLCAPLSPRLDRPTAGVEWYDSGIGFAVPLHGAERILAAMKAGRTLRPGWLGIAFAAVAAPGKGVPVTKVFDGSPAEKAGLRPKDVLLAVDGVTLIDPLALRHRLGRYLAGDAVSLTLRRDGKELNLKVTLAEPPTRRAPRPSRPPTRRPAAPR